MIIWNCLFVLFVIFTDKIPVSQIPDHNLRLLMYHEFEWATLVVFRFVFKLVTTFKLAKSQAWEKPLSIWNDSVINLYTQTRTRHCWWMVIESWNFFCQKARGFVHPIAKCVYHIWIRISNINNIYSSNQIHIC